LYRKGGLGGTPTTPAKLLPVSVAEEAEVPAEAAKLQRMLFGVKSENTHGKDSCWIVTLIR
jgi:hypothetical protein